MSEIQAKAVEVLRPHVPVAVGSVGSVAERLAAQVVYLATLYGGGVVHDFVHNDKNYELWLKHDAGNLQLLAGVVELQGSSPEVLLSLKKDEVAFDDVHMNPKRVAWGERALAVFAKDTGLNLEVEGDAALADILADLRHYADAKGLDFEDAYETGMNNYRAEIRDAFHCQEPASDTPQHAQEARQAAEAPAVDLASQRAAHALPDAFRAQDPSVRGLATMMSVASGATTVRDYDQPTVDLAAPVRQIDTPEFKAWFRKSKIVDRDGQPLVVHHATANEFSAFDPNTSMWFSADRGDAVEYVEGGHTLDCYLHIECPADLDSKMVVGFLEAEQGEAQWVSFGDVELWNLNEDILKVRKALIDYGFDGMKIRHGSGFDHYAAFYPTQIKTIHNCGAFSPTDPDIRR